MQVEPKSVTEWNETYELTRIAGRVILIVAVALILFVIYAFITI